jgi:predicted small lipoprotein YifL
MLYATWGKRMIDTVVVLAVVVIALAGCGNFPE